MALAMVAAASPVINPVREAVAPVALSVPAAPAPLAPVAALAPVALLADASHKQGVAMVDNHGPQQIQPVAGGNTAKPENIDMSKMGMWVPCSESECMKDMTLEQQEAFKRDFSLALASDVPRVSSAVVMSATAALVNRPSAAANAFGGVAHEYSMASVVSHGAPANEPRNVNNDRNVVYAPFGAPAARGFGHESNQQRARREQMSTQPLSDNAVVVPAPDAPDTGDKSKTQQMMLFFPDPKCKLTPEQQQEW
ncbi:hypothetical protein H4S07_003874, partial [Coemansia furcata]